LYLTDEEEKRLMIAARKGIISIITFIKYLGELQFEVKYFPFSGRKIHVE